MVKHFNTHCVHPNAIEQAVQLECHRNALYYNTWYMYTIHNNACMYEAIMVL